MRAQRRRVRPPTFIISSLHLYLPLEYLHPANLSPFILILLTLPLYIEYSTYIAAGGAHTPARYIGTICYVCRRLRISRQKLHEDPILAIY